jgi:hypothetical protein
MGRTHESNAGRQPLDSQAVADSFTSTILVSRMGPRPKWSRSSQRAIDRSWGYAIAPDGLFD